MPQALVNGQVLGLFKNLGGIVRHMCAITRALALINYRYHAAQLALQARTLLLEPFSVALHSLLTEHSTSLQRTDLDFYFTKLVRKSKLTKTVKFRTIRPDYKTVTYPHIDLLRLM